MKIIAALLITICMLGMQGCANQPASATPPPQTLAPGYSSPADQSMGQALVGAHKFYTTIQGDVASGKYTPSPSEKAALNNFSTALNTAQVLYIAFHAGTATQAQAQAAVDKVSSQQTALQSTLTGGK